MLRFLSCSSHHPYFQRFLPLTLQPSAIASFPLRQPPSYINHGNNAIADDSGVGGHIAPIILQSCRICNYYPLFEIVSCDNGNKTPCLFSCRWYPYVALIRDNGLVWELFIHDCLFLSKLWRSVRDVACKLVGDCGESSALSGNSQKPQLFLLLLVVVVLLLVTANSSGRSIMIAGIKLVLLFTHTLLFWFFYTIVLTFLTERDLTEFLLNR
jgi:hypothetical protein